ncbi:hypothetical protein FOA52_009089 [Chlamydomonas sp. UWO 241]|nr:hypothetical protein FOA52_009089 [Chlamydomonas sp. UWO 241]
MCDLHLAVAAVPRRQLSLGIASSHVICDAPRVGDIGDGADGPRVYWVAGVPPEQRRRASTHAKRSPFHRWLVLCSRRPASGPPGSPLQLEVSQPPTPPQLQPPSVSLAASSVESAADQSGQRVPPPPSLDVPALLGAGPTDGSQQYFSSVQPAQGPTSSGFSRDVSQHDGAQPEGWRGRQEMAPGDSEEMIRVHVSEKVLVSEKLLHLTTEMLASGSSDASDYTGRWGEALVFKYLQLDPQVSDMGLSVEWVNEKVESGKPYGICLRKIAGKIEDKTLVEVSAKEVQLAIKEGSRYHVYRVHGAGSAMGSISKFTGPVDKWHRQELKVFMHLPV